MFRPIFFIALTTLYLFSFSGAGKSEVTRMILRYLATGTPWQQLKRTSEPENLCFAMVALDSFGTACVGRNHRSTRFTALYDLIYDTRNLPVGGHIDVAFLEASSIAADNVIRTSSRTPRAPFL